MFFHCLGPKNEIMIYASNQLGLKNNVCLKFVDFGIAGLKLMAAHLNKIYISNLYLLTYQKSIMKKNITFSLHIMIFW